MKYHAPDDRTEIEDPTPDQMEVILRNSPHLYWQQGGNGEASLEVGPGLPSLWIKQPEPLLFFVTFFKPRTDWLVPYNGESCDALIRDERGGDPFWIPRACVIGMDQAVDVVRHFIRHHEPSPAVRWCCWGQLPLPDSYPEP